LSLFLFPKFDALSIKMSSFDFFYFFSLYNAFAFPCCCFPTNMTISVLCVAILINTIFYMSTKLSTKSNFTIKFYGGEWNTTIYKFELNPNFKNDWHINMIKRLIPNLITFSSFEKFQGKLVNIHSKVVAHVDINGSMIIKFWLVLNFTKFKFIFSLDLESKCQGVTKLSNAIFSYGKIEVLYILKNYGYKMEVVPYRFTCSLLQTSWKPPWTKYGEQLTIFFPIFFFFAIDGFSMKNCVCQNHTTL
jgi:hypothetical protein